MAGQREARGTDGVLKPSGAPVNNAEMTVNSSIWITTRLREQRWYDTHTENVIGLLPRFEEARHLWSFVRLSQGRG